MKRTLVSPAGLLLVAGVLLLPGVGAAKDLAPVYASKASSMKIAAQLQFRYTYIEKADGAEDATSTFGWKRARLTFSGDLSDNLYYQWRFQGDDLPDAFSFSTTYLGYHMGPVGDLELGRFDVECTPRSSSSKQPMAERPFHVERNKAGSQLGAHYSNMWLDERVGVELGMYNGNGDHSSDVGNDNDKFLYAARLYLSPNKNFDYNTGTDLAHSDWGVGFLGGYWTSDNRYSSDKVSYQTTVNQGPPVTVSVKQVTTTTISDAKVKTYGAALYARGKGLYLTGEYTKRKSESDTAKYDFDAKGYSISAAYAIPLPAKGMFIEPALRYETYKDTYKAEDPTNPEADFAWTTIGLNWYLKKYDASFQADYIIKKERGDADSVDNNQFMLQGNLNF